MLDLEGDPVFRDAHVLPVQAASWVDEDRGRSESFSVTVMSERGSVTFHFSNRGAADAFRSRVEADLRSRAFPR